MPDVTANTVRHFTFYDPRERLVVVALGAVGGREEIVGLADVSLHETGLGEIGIVVADDLQRRGVGRLLIEAVASLALRRGATHLKAECSTRTTRCCSCCARSGRRVVEARSGRMQRACTATAGASAATRRSARWMQPWLRPTTHRRNSSPSTRPPASASALCPRSAPEEVQAVVDDVAEVQPFWAQLPLEERARYMRRTAQVIIDNLDELTTLLAREQGKPRNEAYVMELMPDDRRARLDRRQRPEHPRRRAHQAAAAVPAQKRAKFSYEPLGVVGVIAPWNYPWSIPFGEVAIALMAGNGVVLKPASLTPLIGEQIRGCSSARGCPRASCAPCTAAAAWATRWSSRARPRSSSPARSRWAAAWAIACAERMKGSRARAGRQGRADRARRREPAERDLRLPVGRVRQRRPDLLGHRARVRDARASPTASSRESWQGAQAAARRRPDELGHRDRADGVGGAVRARARSWWTTPWRTAPTLHCGGPTEVDGFEGDFYAPAVLTGVTHDMRIMREEIFGPVVPIVDGRLARRRRSGSPTTPSSGSALPCGRSTARKGERIAAPDRVGHGLDQRPHVLARRDAVRRGAA